MSVKGQMSGSMSQCHRRTYCETMMWNNLFSRNARSTDTAIKKKERKKKKEKKSVNIISQSSGAVAVASACEPFCRFKQSRNVVKFDSSVHESPTLNKSATVCSSAGDRQGAGARWGADGAQVVMPHIHHGSMYVCTFRPGKLVDWHEINAHGCYLLYPCHVLQSWRSSKMEQKQRICTSSHDCDNYSLLFK